MFFHYEVFPTGLDFYPSAVGCSALGWELLLGVLRVLQPQGPWEKAAHPQPAHTAVAQAVGETQGASQCTRLPALGE